MIAKDEDYPAKVCVHCLVHPAPNAPRDFFFPRMFLGFLQPVPTCKGDHESGLML